MQRDATLTEVLNKLAEHVQEYKTGEYGFRAYINPSRSQSVFGSCSTPSIVRLFITDFREFLNYETMAGASVFNMNTQIKNLPTTDLEVIKSTPGTHKHNLEKYMKSLSTFNIPTLEDNKQAEEVKEQDTANEVYEVIYLTEPRNS